jgi:hypothetical protein
VARFHDKLDVPDMMPLADTSALGIGGRRFPGPSEIKIPPLFGPR